MMTKTEEILVLCMNMTEEQLRGLNKLLEQRAEALRKERVEEA